MVNICPDCGYPLDAEAHFTSHAEAPRSVEDMVNDIENHASRARVDALLSAYFGARRGA